MGWRDLAGAGLRVQVVPGSHVRILQQPYVPVLARKLQRCLDEAERSY
jgi:thioesterase domain-containing protein